MLGYVFGFLGVASFSLTLPATRVAVHSIDPMLVASGRAVAAAALAPSACSLARAARPRGSQWWQRGRRRAMPGVSSSPISRALAPLTRPPRMAR